MHFKLKISPEYYAELNMTGSIGNNGKRHSEIIGKAHVNYTFYPNGTVNIEVQSSNSPLRLGDEIDRTRPHVFLGQLRDRMITFLIDRHERIVPDILEWDVTECDINKDIKVSDAVHFTGIKIQVKHVDHLFRIYTKSIGENTECRVEESGHPNKPAIDMTENFSYVLGLDIIAYSTEGLNRTSPGSITLKSSSYVTSGSFRFSIIFHTLIFTLYMLGGQSIGISHSQEIQFALISP
jgi:hypothetical protein